VEEKYMGEENFCSVTLSITNSIQITLEMKLGTCSKNMATISISKSYDTPTIFTIHSWLDSYKKKPYKYVIN
jgi:hypothetical protein